MGQMREIGYEGRTQGWHYLTHSPYPNQMENVVNSRLACVPRTYRTVRGLFGAPPRTEPRASLFGFEVRKLLSGTGTRVEVSAPS
jgi:hypothetical protein